MIKIMKYLILFLERKKSFVLLIEWWRYN